MPFSLGAKPPAPNWANLMRKQGAHFTRHTDPLAAFRAAGRQHPLDTSQKLRLGVALRTHLEALRTGKADQYAFHNLANAVNTSMVLAENGGPGFEYDDLIGGAQDAMIRLKTNGNIKGRWLLGGPGLNAITAWLEVYEAQLEIVSKQEAMNALDEVGRRVARGQVFEDQSQGVAP